MPKLDLLTYVICLRTLRVSTTGALAVMALLLKEEKLRDWSLITGRGGYKTGGGAREVLPLRKGLAEKVLAMLKGGHNKFWGHFYVVA